MHEKKMQCEIKLIRCDNETMRIIYENNVVPVPFSACCTCPFYSILLFFLRKKEIFYQFWAFIGFIHGPESARSKIKAFGAYEEKKKNERMKHARETRAWLQKQLHTLTLCDRTLRDGNKI